MLVQQSALLHFFRKRPRCVLFGPCALMKTNMVIDLLIYQPLCHYNTFCHLFWRIKFHFQIAYIYFIPLATFEIINMILQIYTSFQNRFSEGLKVQYNVREPTGVGVWVLGGLVAQLTSNISDAPQLPENKLSFSPSTPKSLSRVPFTSLNKC